MQKYLIMSLLASLITTTSFAKPPQNLTCAKRAIVAYYNSTEFTSDVDAVVKNAEKYLYDRVAENNNAVEHKKLAMVLDIDDTSLSNFIGNKKRDFSGLPAMIEDSYREANAPAIEPVLRLYNEAIQLGVNVFFISFRPDTVRSYTITNLQNVGYYGWSNLYLPNQDEVKLPANEFKTAVRAMLTKQGYDIIINLGDQDTDIVGGYADYTGKIPNPLYSSAPVCEGLACG